LTILDHFRVLAPLIAMSKTVEEHGWTAVPRSLEKLVNDRKNPKDATAIRVEDIAIPNSPLAQSVLKYAKENLPKQTFNHSMRVYCFGMSSTRNISQFQCLLDLTCSFLRSSYQLPAFSRLALQPRNFPPRGAPSRYRHHARQHLFDTSFL